MENKIRKVIREQIKNLAEMFPNRQGPRKVNLDSIADVDNTGWTPDGGGGSIGYAEWEDGTEMTPLEIQDYFEFNHELYDDIMQGLHEMYNRGPVSIDEKEVDVDSIEMEGMDWRGGHDDGTTDRYVAAASFKDGTPLTDDQRDRFLDKYPELTQELAIQQMEEGDNNKEKSKPNFIDVTSTDDDPDSDLAYAQRHGMTNTMEAEKDPDDDKEQEEWDKGWYGESLKEAANKLGYLKND